MLGVDMEIKNIAVIGAGMMGKMIAFVFSSKYQVGVYDVAAHDVVSGIRKSAVDLVEKGVLSANELETRLSRICVAGDLSDKLISDADLVIESVFEDMGLKQGVFAQLEDICREDCIFCTNTSVMSPSEISRHLKHRGRFAAAHFWNPAHLVPLVEVVMSDATGPEIAQAVMGILASVGKKPVLCKKDVPGFVANRLQHALWREAMYMVEQGIADPKTVDDSCKYGPGLRWPVLGPLENSDLVGIDLTYNIHNYVLSSLADNHEPSYLLREMIGRGELGMKSGRGWQEWAPEQAELVRAGLQEYLIDAASRKEDKGE